ncbi:MAG: DUF1467 family protein [Pseudomonadota bacterium]
MDWFGAVVVFVLSSWLVFFMIASAGITTQAEDGHVVEGSEPSAPINPQIGKKALISMAGGAVITLIVFVAEVLGVFSYLLRIAMPA